MKNWTSATQIKKQSDIEVGTIFRDLKRNQFWKVMKIEPTRFHLSHSVNKIEDLDKITSSTGHYDYDTCAIWKDMEYLNPDHVVWPANSYPIEFGT